MNYPTEIDKEGQVWLLRPDGRRRGVSRQCKNCNQEFLTFNWIVRRGEGHFCSRKCNRQYNNHKRHVAKKCVVCHSLYMVQRAKAHRYKTCRKPFCFRKQLLKNAAKARAAKVK